MKRFITIPLIIVFTLCLTGCGNVEDSINKKSLDDYIDYYDGMKYLKCDDLNKYDVIDFNGSVLLLSNNIAYSVLMTEDKYYSNDQQCKPISEDIKFRYITDGRILVGDNKKSYYYNNTDGLKERDFTPDLMLDSSVTKVTNPEMTEEERKKYPYESKNYNDKYIYMNYSKYYYIKDGSIYQGIIKSTTTNYYSTDKTKTDNVLVEEKVLYDKEKYGNITDYRRLENKSVGYTKIVSDKGIYTLTDIETEECKKYVDVECEKDFEKDDRLDNYLDNIKYLNTSYLITKNNSIGYIDDLINYVSK